MASKGKADRITIEKLNKYREITSKAFALAKSSISPSTIKEAEEILMMADCYISDSEYFRKKEDFVNSLAALSYAHGWLDAGARLGIFKVKDSKIFTIE